MSRPQASRPLLVFGGCLVFWFLLSGHVGPLDLIFGVAASAAVAWINRRDEALSDLLAWTPRLLAYLPWLLREIWVANIQVVRLVLDPRLPIDPVVVRQNWLKAYDFVTDRAAVTLNEYARDNDPFARVGRETVAVEVASVVRASDSSFQVRWLERIFEGGALKDTKRLTGLFSIVITPPRTVEAVRKNPLGIYVHTFNWSQDVTAGEPK